MPDTDATLVSEIIGRKVVDVGGDKIGTVEDVYLEDHSGQPEWLAVSTGWFGTSVSFVPMEGASFTGEVVAVAYTKDQVKAAPYAASDGHLEDDEQARLYAHYGRRHSGAAAVNTAGDDVDDVRATEGHDTSGPTTDAAMTRSEEELRVDKHTREAGRVRLRKWIETDNVHLAVPIRREAARVVTEPITDASIDRAMDGPDLSSEEHEVVLTEEVVDVEKRVVPQERVRLETEAVTEDVAVDETVRKERIGYEGVDENLSR